MNETNSTVSADFPKYQMSPSLQAGPLFRPGAFGQEYRRVTHSKAEKLLTPRNRPIPNRRSCIALPQQHQQLPVPSLSGPSPPTPSLAAHSIPLLPGPSPYCRTSTCFLLNTLRASSISAKRRSRSSLRRRCTKGGGHTVCL